MLKKIILHMFLMSFVSFYGQSITVNTTTYTVPQLVQNVLFGATAQNSCAGGVTNITWSTGSNFNSTNGIGYFQNTNPNFPLANGVILSTGNVLSAAGPNSGTQSNGSGNWPGDTQLFNYIDGLGIDADLNSYNNATVLEFDFVPFSSSMSFDFLFASEEYGTFQCDFSDAFAFFLTDVTAGTAPINLALVPNTNTPIAVTTIRNNANNNACPSANSQYFGLFNGGTAATTASNNFNGQTVKMTAQSAVVPFNNYHIKLVIADRNDSQYDSAVFLGGGSFNVGTADISGTGIYSNTHSFLIAEGNAVCPNKTLQLKASATPIPNITYTWEKNNVVLPGETSYNLTVTTEGTYKANLIFSPTCIQSDECVVEYNSELDLTTPTATQSTICQSSSTFNLNQFVPIILNGLSAADYEVFFYTSSANAQAGTNHITNLNAYPGTDNQTIYVSVTDLIGSNCTEYRQFQLHINPLSDAVVSGTATVNLNSSSPSVTFTGSGGVAPYTFTYN
ncbi:choice-of-anchor L domain-containing protein, partial [Flavobacterium branchiophilum]